MFTYSLHKEDLESIENKYNEALENFHIYNGKKNAEMNNYYLGILNGIEFLMDLLGYSWKPKTVYNFEPKKESVENGTDDESETDTEAFEG